MPAPQRITVTTGSERLVHVYDAERTSSGGSASGSRQSSGASRSLSADSWSDVGDDIDPSDSASHPRNRSRRHTVEVPEVPTRRESSRRPRVAQQESSHRRRPESQRYHSDRREAPPERATSRRAASGDSASSLASPDDYPYSHPAVPRPYPPGGYRGPPQPGQGGYPPSMASAGGYYEPYQPPHQALIMHERPDAFGYRPDANPFASQPRGNPFASPVTDGHQGGYFAPEPPGAPMPPPPQPQQRPHRHSRPQSYVAPPQHYSSDVMAPYQALMHHYPQYPMQGYPPPMPPFNWTQSQVGSQVPKENVELEAIKEMLTARLATEQKKEGVKNVEIEQLKAALDTIKSEAAARQKAWDAEKAREAAAKAAAELKEQEDKRKKEEIAAASKKAKEDAETKAAAEAKKTKDEADKKLAEATKAKEESETKKKELEETLKANAPAPDSTKPPIKFKDAVGRKFSFPWAICKTWKGMEGLIKQAFLHVDSIGDHVHQGHYDLTGPDGEIILPQVWDTMVQPDWEITMHLWPMPEEKGKKPAIPLDDFGDWDMRGGMFGGPPGIGSLPGEMGGRRGNPLGDELDRAFGRFNVGHGGKVDIRGGKKPVVKSSEKKKHGSPKDGVINVNVGPGQGRHSMMGPPPGPAGFGDPFGGLPMGGLGGYGGPSGQHMFVAEKPPKDKSKSKSKKSGKEVSGIAAFFAGAGAPVKSRSKK